MTLVQLFTAIANAIRAKKGSSSTIVAENFPTEIESISTGIDTSDATATAGDILKDKTAYANGQKITGTIIGGDYLDTSADTVTYDSNNNSLAMRSNFNNPKYIRNYVVVSKGGSNIASAIGLTANILKQNETVLGITGSYAGTTPTGSISITQNGTVDVTNYAEAVVNVSAGGGHNATITGTHLTGIEADLRKCITSIDNDSIVLPSNVTQAANFFNACSFLVTAPTMDTKKIVSMNYMFYNCSSLQNVPVYNTSKVQAMSQMFYNCSSLTDQSLSNILTMCTNSAITSSSSKKLKTLSLTSDQATRCTALPEWTAAQAAGWTTGY